jgi:hypothetical protein
MVIDSFSIRVVVTTRSIYLETWVHDLNLVFYTLGYWMLFNPRQTLGSTLSGCVFWDCPAPWVLLPYAKVFLDQYRNFIVHSTHVELWSMVIWVQFGQRLINKLFLDMPKFSNNIYISQRQFFVRRKRAKNIFGNIQVVEMNFFQN